MDKKGMTMETAFFMFVAALFVDGLQFVLDWIFIGLILGPFIDAVAWLVFRIWFDHAGIDTTGMNVTGVVELIPGLDGIPAWTFYIGIVIFSNYGRNTVGKIEEAVVSTRRPRNR